jgi:hypothetical protein
MIKLLRHHVAVFAVLFLSLSVTTVLWSRTLLANLALLELTTITATTATTIGTEGMIPPHDAVRVGRKRYSKRPWNQPDLTFTLKSVKDDADSNVGDGGGSGASRRRPERSERHQKKIAGHSNEKKRNKKRTTRKKMTKKRRGQQRR